MYTEGIIFKIFNKYLRIYHCLLSKGETDLDTTFNSLWITRESDIFSRTGRSNYLMNRLFRKSNNLLIGERTRTRDHSRRNYSSEAQPSTAFFTSSGSQRWARQSWKTDFWITPLPSSSRASRGAKRWGGFLRHEALSQKSVFQLWRYVRRQRENEDFISFWRASRSG